MEGVGNDVLALIATGSLATAGILAFYYYYFFFPHPQSRPTSSAPQQHEAAVSVSHPQPQPSEKDVVRETEPVRNTRIPEIPDQQRAPGDITITFKVRQFSAVTLIDSFLVQWRSKPKATVYLYTTQYVNDHLRLDFCCFQA